MLRKAMGKKDPAVMERYHDAFINGAAKNGISKKDAEAIYQQMAKFAGYGFNKSHSAAYALIAYQTAYLKANHPIEYMAALLSSEMGNTTKLATYIEECRVMGIPVLPPDINQSHLKFTVANGEIRFGLAAVKNVGESAIRVLVDEREKEGPFKSLFDFCSRVDLRLFNKRVIESLAKCGAFDAEGVTRSRIFASVDLALEQGQTAQRDRDMGQTQLFDVFDGDEGYSPVQYPEVEEWPDSKQLKFEKEVLGLFISGHPLTRYSDTLSAMTTTNSAGLQQLKEGESVVIGGMVSRIKTIVPKRRQERMAFVTLEDTDGIAEIVVFSDLFANTSELLREDSLIAVAGRVSYKDSEAKIVAETIVPIDKAAEEFARFSHVKLMTAGLGDDTLEKLAEIVSDNEGPCRLFIHCVTPETTEVVVESTVTRGLRPSVSVKEQVETLLGRGSVWFSLKNEVDLSGTVSGT
jgi:DNA polymerase-3 subunit alpha